MKKRGEGSNIMEVRYPVTAAITNNFHPKSYPLEFILVVFQFLALLAILL